MQSLLLLAWKWAGRKPGHWPPLGEADVRGGLARGPGLAPECPELGGRMGRLVVKAMASGQAPGSKSQLCPNEHSFSVPQFPHV